MRRRQGGFLQLPCSLGFRLAFSATGGARLRPPRPAFEKSGGKLAGKLFRFSGGICWRAAHRERPARFVDRFWSGKIGASFERAEKTAASWGGGGRAPRAQSMGGALGPAHALVLRVLRARKTPPPPRAGPAPPTAPSPAHLRRPYGGGPVAQEGPGVPPGAAAFGSRGRPQGRPRPAKQKERARG